MSNNTEEDKALLDWLNQPEDPAEIQRSIWPWREKAFREGFRAGQRHTKPGSLADAAINSTILERELLGYIKEIHARLDVATERANEQQKRIEELESLVDRIRHCPAIESDV